MHVRSLLLALALLPGLAHTEDKDKAKLFNTFYFDGDSVTYIIELRKDRTFTLAGPSGQVVYGQFRPSDKEVGIDTITAHRHFEYKADRNGDMVFESSKHDTQTDGDVLGAMPPRGDEKARFVTLANWRKKGRAAEHPALAQYGGMLPQPGAIPAPAPAPAPAAPAPAPQPATQAVALPEPPPPLPATGDTITGIFYVLDAQGKTQLLRLAPNGTFEFESPAGKAKGDYLLLNSELTLDARTHRRQFRALQTTAGLVLQRREPDVLKLGDPLGEMIPQERAPALWKRNDQTGGVLSDMGKAIIKQAPKIDAVPLPGEEPAPAPPANAPAPAPGVAPPPPPPPVETNKPGAAAPELKAPGALADLNGSYTCIPNPLISETWIMKGNSFEYRDSNGAKCEGSAVYKDGVLTLTCAEVIREFSVQLDGAAVLLLRTKNDNPRITNDLASMSPAVLPAARYERDK